MPEYGELVAQIFILMSYIDYIAIFFSENPRLAVEELTLKNIWVDSSDKERKLALETPSKANVLQRAGIPHPLMPTSRIRRGGVPTDTNRPYVWPVEFIKTIEELRKLVLVDVISNPRNVILDFGCMVCQVQLFTHCMIQVFSLDDFFNNYCRISSMLRAKVGVAFQFKDRVVVFTSLDLLIKIHWALRREDLPAQHVDIYDNPKLFLEELFLWMVSRFRTAGNRDGPVATMVRSECTLFAGVGLYTVCEIFHLAGLSPFMSEKEFLHSPSRVARFLLAYYQWSEKQHVEIPKLVKKHVFDWKLAVNESDKRTYLNHLEVFGKMSALSTQRHQQAMELRVSSARKGVPFAHLKDVWEPTSLWSALAKFPTLEAIAFGALLDGTKPLAAVVKKQNKPLPLTDADAIVREYFLPYWKVTTGDPLSRTELDSSMFENDSRRTVPGAECRFPIPVYAYRVGTEGRKAQVWTTELVTRDHQWKGELGYGRNLPLEGLAVLPKLHTYYKDQTKLTHCRIPDPMPIDEQEANSGAKILGTYKHFVGALDFNGACAYITPQGGRKHALIAVCAYDNRLSAAYHEKVIKMFKVHVGGAENTFIDAYDELMGTELDAMAACGADINMESEKDNTPLVAPVFTHGGDVDEGQRTLFGAAERRLRWIQRELDIEGMLIGIEHDRNPGLYDRYHALAYPGNKSWIDFLDEFIHPSAAEEARVESLYKLPRASDLAPTNTKSKKSSITNLPGPTSLHKYFEVTTPSSVHLLPPTVAQILDKAKKRNFDKIRPGFGPGFSDTKIPYVQKADPLLAMIEKVQKHKALLASDRGYRQSTWPSICNKMAKKIEYDRIGAAGALVEEDSVSEFKKAAKRRKSSDDRLMEENFALDLRPSKRSTKGSKLPSPGVDM